MYPIYTMLRSEQITKEVMIAFPMQHQEHMPGLESKMNPTPISDNMEYCGSGKLKDKVALITGGDSGIGRSLAIIFAKEGCDVAISYLYEDEDAELTKQYVEEYGRRCVLIRGDLRLEETCKKTIEVTIQEYGRLDILVNNHAVQFISRSLSDITEEQLDITFKTNVYSYFFLTKAALPYLKEGSSIINTTSVTAYLGNEDLIDYSATKGAIVSFTRSLSKSLVKYGIRVNAVSPGPIWTPLIPASYSKEETATFGTFTSEVPMKRAGQPFEVAPSYVFLASNDSRYMTGQVLHPNGGLIVGS